MQRVKGHSFEREIAKKLRGIFPEARRHLEFQKENAALGQDLVNTGILKIQCKRGRAYAPITKITEVKIDEQGGIPVLVTQGDRQDAMAVLSFDDLIFLLSHLKASNGALLE